MELILIPRLLLLNLLIYFFPVDGNIAWRINTNSDLVAFYAKHGDIDIVTDLEYFPIPSS